VRILSPSIRTPRALGKSYDELVKVGVSDLSFEECRNAYLDHELTALFIAVHASVCVKRTECGNRM